MQIDDAANEVKVTGELMDAMHLIRQHYGAVVVTIERRKEHLLPVNAKQLIDALAVAHAAAEAYFGLLDELGAFDDANTNHDGPAANPDKDGRYLVIAPRPLWFDE